MKTLLVALTLALPSLASAFEVVVRHDGMSKHYQIADGETVDDVWHLRPHQGPDWLRTTRHDLRVHLELHDAGNGSAVCNASVDAVRGHKVRTIFAPTVLFLTGDDPFAALVVGKQIPSVGEDGVGHLFVVVDAVEVRASRPTSR